MVLPTDVGYLTLALHAKSFQAFCVGSEYCPCLTGIQKNRQDKSLLYSRTFITNERYRSIQTCCRKDGLLYS